eukprot:CAMPEP_0183340914 /NCGR_PEP_ID=MMETSP0164_2-20130417/7303_1 /TAXON_ID=221442 /ORGANISM="Coccolithus pelagicus ssp braarudi, Strain PLY182g" /LENGTH=248 /DNA_ID=CAMNT_0025511121 /DNA_START=16 /DNA_END=762 /DNA_ORIENTATION=-
MAEVAAELISSLLSGSTDSFDALGIPHEKHTPAQVRTAFRRRSLSIHPDKCEHDKATEAFNALVAAFESLHDPTSQERALRLSQASEPRAKRSRAAGINCGAARRSRSGASDQRGRSWCDWDEALRRYDELESSFRTAQRERFARRRAAHTLRQAEQACIELDERAGVADNPLVETPDSGADSTGGVQGEEDPSNPHRLVQLLLYLRDEHSYCIYCATRYTDSEDMASHCPGLTEVEHELDNDPLDDS